MILHAALVSRVMEWGQASVVVGQWLLTDLESMLIVVTTHRWHSCDLAQLGHPDVISTDNISCFTQTHSTVIYTNYLAASKQTLAKLAMERMSYFINWMVQRGWLDLHITWTVVKNTNCMKVTTESRHRFKTKGKYCILIGVLFVKIKNLTLL